MKVLLAVVKEGIHCLVSPSHPPQKLVNDGFTENGKTMEIYWEMSLVGMECLPGRIM